MKIELINEKQIKCVLNRSDLAMHQLRVGEIVYGTEKTKDLFQDMITQAEDQFGFEASDIPLLIEAIPVSMDCIILMITKVEDPDGLDNGVTGLSTLTDLLAEDTEDEEPMEDISLAEDMTEAVPRTRLPRDRQNAAGLDERQIERMFSFAALEDVISYAKCAYPGYRGASALYKSPETGRYYLLLEKGAADIKEFGQMCNTALEFGSREPLGFAGVAFMNEHYSLLIRDGAIQSLANV